MSDQKSNWTSLAQWFENDQTARVKLREATDRYHEFMDEVFELQDHIARESDLRGYFDFDQIKHFVLNLPRSWKKK